MPTPKFRATARGPVLDLQALPSSLKTLLWQVTLAPVSRNDSMEPDTNKSQLVPKQNCLSVVALFYFRQGNLRPNLDDPAMAVLRSYPKAGKTNSQARPFKELVSRPGQRSECTVILMRNNAVSKSSARNATYTAVQSKPLSSFELNGLAVWLPISIMEFPMTPMSAKHYTLRSSTCIVQSIHTIPK
jgi:hypothetical protein